MSPFKKQGSPKLRRIIIFTLAVGIVLWYSGIGGKIGGFSGESKQEREKLYNNALAEAAKSPSWPTTEQALISAFWAAIAKGDLKQATLYCPGSSESDYAGYTRLNPSPNIRIGQAQPHPTAKSVTLWTCQVSFSYLGNKTLKFATSKNPSGQFIIDGQNTIWW